MTRPKAIATVLIAAACVYGSTSVAAPEQIVNPTEPPLIETWDLREVWRLGGEDDAPEAPLLGVISRGVVDTEGSVFLLDTQLSQVLVIGADGQYQATLSRPGDGPGEIRRPADLWLYPDGRVGLLQSYPAKFVILERDGTPAGGITMDSPAINMWRVRTAAGLTVVTGQRNDYEMKTPGRSTTYRFIASILPSGERDHVYLDKTIVTRWEPPVSDEGNSWFPGYAWDLMPDGTVVLAPERDRYRLEFIDRQGEVTREMTREYPQYRRTAAEKDAVRQNMSMTSNGRELKVKKIVLDTEPVIRTLAVLHAGAIWVTTAYSERELPDGVYQRYDVLDAQGHLLKEVRLVCPARRGEDAFGVMADGRFLWIRNLSAAFRGMYPQAEAGKGSDDLDDVRLEVIVLERSG